MKTLFYVLFFLPCVLFSQIKIEGYVYNEKGESIFGTSVYVDGSTIGTITNELGYFSLVIPSESNSALVFRNIGYISEVIELRKITIPIRVFLKEDVKVLKEVFINQNYFTRKQMLKVFKEQFLGTTSGGKNCIIENEDDLYFDYDRKTLTFKTYSDKPLIIVNKFLGYRIEYQLVDFHCRMNRFGMNSKYVNQLIYAGSSLFTEIDSSQKILKRRINSYSGSTLHFFRNLIGNKWDKNEFLLFEGSFVTNAELHLKVIPVENEMYKVEVSPNKKIILKDKFFNVFSILYDSKEQSKIQFYTNEFYVDSFGVFTNYDQILFSGDIISKRIGDLVPTNFLK